MTIGMKIFGQIVSVQPLALIVSLPNQLFGHVPITQISSELTGALEAMDQDQDEDDAGSEEEGPASKSTAPGLIEIFSPGQYVRAVVTAVHAAGSSDLTGMGKSRDEVSRASRRVELSLYPEKVNVGVQKNDLRAGFVSSSQVSHGMR